MWPAYRLFFFQLLVFALGLNPLDYCKSVTMSWLGWRIRRWVCTDSDVISRLQSVRRGLFSAFSDPNTLLMFSSASTGFASRSASSSRSPYNGKGANLLMCSQRVPAPCAPADRVVSLCSEKVAAPWCSASSLCILMYEVYHGTAPYYLRELWRRSTTFHPTWELFCR